MEHHYTKSLGHPDIKFYHPPQRGPTHLIKPKFTEPCYTEEALPCKSTPSIHSSTTPNKYNL